MKLSQSSLVLAALSLAAMAAAPSAQAQTTTPHSHFEVSTITSTTNTIEASRVAGVDSNDVFHYWDVVLAFDTNPDGSLTLAPGYPTYTASDPLLTVHFKAGKYVAPNGDAITVSGPGVTSGGATEWSLAATTGPSGTCAFPFSATWYVGTLSNNPLYSRLKTAGITSTAYSYGLLGTAAGCGNPYEWGSGAVLGFSQTSNALTIVTFTNSYNNAGDSATPIAQITYTYQP
jgi:hypothetical protein